MNIKLFRSSHDSAHTEADSSNEAVGIRGVQQITEEIERCVQPLTEQSKETQKQITLLRHELRRFGERLGNGERGLFSTRDLLLVAIVLVVQMFVTWFSSPATPPCAK